MAQVFPVRHPAANVETGRNDALLMPLLESADEARRSQVMTDLFTEHVFWRIDRILGARFRQSRLGGEHRDDVRGEIVLRLMNRLHRLIAAPEVRPIETFPDYVAVVAFHTFDDYVRRAYPMRMKLKNRIRYALRHEPGLTLWPSGGSMLCGFAQWKGIAVAPDEPSPQLHAEAEDLPALLHAIFEQHGKPVELDALVSAVAQIYGVDEHDPAELRDGDAAEPRRDPIDHLEDLQYLRKLWEEIGELPLRQRTALLLNARDPAGESIVRLLPVTGVATIRQIAAALAMDAEVLADLWHELPIEDIRIAEMLQGTRQQVINLRRSARERLLRRMRPGGSSSR
jgi:hypothetical protein